MSDTKLTQEDVQQILRLIESAEHVAEFHLRFGDLEVGLSRSNGSAWPPAAVIVPPAADEAAADEAAAAAQPETVAPGAAVVKAPMVGTVYRAPAPGAPPFVEVGASVDAETTVCIIEVMKLMNSIPAGVRGTLREIRVADGQAVEFDQVLMVIEPQR